MKKQILITLVHLLALSSFSQSQEKTESIIEYHENNALILQKAVYDGFELYNPENSRSVYSARLPKGYAYYINLKDWEKFVKTVEPNYYKNLKKYKSSSSSNKEMYLNLFKEKLNKIQIRDSKTGKFPFERVVTLDYIDASRNYSRNKNHFKKIKLEFKRRDYETKNYEFYLTEWSKCLKKYDFVKEVKETVNLEDIDLIVQKNDVLDKEMKDLYFYKKQKPLLKENVATLKEFDLSIKKIQAQYPSKFKNKSRLQRTRELHIEKIKNKEKIEFANSKGLLDDLDFKFTRVLMLKQILSNGYYKKNILNEWYLKKSNTVPYHLFENGKWVSIGERPFS